VLGPGLERGRRFGRQILSLPGLPFRRPSEHLDGQLDRPLGPDEYAEEGLGSRKRRAVDIAEHLSLHCHPIPPPLERIREDRVARQELCHDVGARAP
jgi:hypothetical protein